jgi:hypothetical protein
VQKIIEKYRLEERVMEMSSACGSLEGRVGSMNLARLF